MTSFGRQLMVTVDVKGYGPSDDRRQERIQRYLTLVLDTAAQRAGLHRATWERQVAGDGELALLPGTEPEPTVVDDYTRHLAHEIHQLNSDMATHRRLQVRMAIHFGVASPAPFGYSGQGPVTVSRLLDSTPLRAALDGADLAVMVSDTVYQGVVANGHTTLRPQQFAHVQVQVKELDTQAYVFLPGVVDPSWPAAARVRAAPAEPPRTPPSAARPAPGAAGPGSEAGGQGSAGQGSGGNGSGGTVVNQEFHAPLTIDTWVIGNNHASDRHG